MSNGKPISCNYHCHTKRCGHAIGEDEEYVEEAIAGHYDVLGFSDHVILDHHKQEGMRGDFSLLPGYVHSIKSLAAKYKDDIEIHLGFEAEWFYEEYRSYYEKLLSDGLVQYFILGQHCFLTDDDRFFWYCAMADRDLATRKYTEDLLSGMRSGLYRYVAHPDLFASWNEGWTDTCEESARKIISLAKDLKMPLEINMGPATREQRDFVNSNLNHFYPNSRFWDLVAEAGAKAIIGVDAHIPGLLQSAPFDWVRDFAKKRGIEVIERLDLPLLV